MSIPESYVLDSKPELGMGQVSNDAVRVRDFLGQRAGEYVIQEDEARGLCLWC